MTGIAQLGFGDKADGRSALIARPFTLGSGRPDPRYFQPRPSQSDYSAGATSFSNRGPASPLARAFHRKQLDAYLELNGPYDPWLTRARVPVDAVTTTDVRLLGLIGEPRVKVRELNRALDEAR